MEKGIIVIGGAGGVGKTTTAAALAYQSAIETERSVLVITIDPAKRLASAMGVGSIGHQPTAITLPAGARGRLAASMVDMKLAWDGMIERCSPDPVVAKRILANPMYESISSRFVQSHNYIAVEVLHEFVKDGTYDLIVVDTPPSRRAMDFLDAPGRMDEFFSSRLLRWLTIPGRSRVLMAAFRPFYAIAERIIGSNALEQLSSFFLDFQLLYDGFVERAQEVDQMLHSASAGFVVVTTPEESPTTEARSLLSALETRGFAVSCVVMNRSLPDEVFSEDADRVASELIARSGALAHELSATRVHTSADDGRAVSSLHGEEQITSRVLVELATCYDTLRAMKSMEELQVRRIPLPEQALLRAPQLEGDIASLDRLGLLGASLWRDDEPLR
jgi:anion-transporting  ArsA/GET3 family ATPase